MYIRTYGAHANHQWTRMAKYDVHTHTCTTATRTHKHMPTDRQADTQAHAYSHTYMHTSTCLQTGRQTHKHMPTATHTCTQAHAYRQAGRHTSTCLQPHIHAHKHMPTDRQADTQEPVRQHGVLLCTASEVHIISGQTIIVKVCAKMAYYIHHRTHTYISVHILTVRTVRLHPTSSLVD